MFVIHHQDYKLLHFYKQKQLWTNMSNIGIGQNFNIDASLSYIFSAFYCAPYFSSKSWPLSSVSTAFLRTFFDIFPDIFVLKKKVIYVHQGWFEGE